MTAVAWTKPTAPTCEATPAPAVASPRLVSLDVMRGLLILAMLVVNNIGDASAVGYFWRHADWRSRPLLESFRDWRMEWIARGPAALLDCPIFRNCTLADLVMPLFMLIIGVAIPFSAAAASRRGIVGRRYWLGVVRRGATLYALGWCIDGSLTFVNWQHSPDAGAKLTFVLGMNVLQLLGVSFVLARLLYALPIAPRLFGAALLFAGHWALLRFLPQGAVPAGTFTELHNAPGYLYSTLALFGSATIGDGLKFNIVGMLSVPPAVATMTLGTWMGQTLRDETIATTSKVRRLLLGGMILIVVGLAWSGDLPMNKPRWTPCYLLYCSGIGATLLATFFEVIDVRRLRRWSGPLVVLGVNAIGIYVLSILAKIWLLNLPRVHHNDGHASLLTTFVQTLQRHTTPTVGSWMFTVLFITAVWCCAALAYRKRLIWKV